MSNNYRKIYKDFYGEIPKDETGRTYDIHHIDGDRSNNNITNLIAVSIKEHYEIHLSQKDYGACLRIASKMKLPHEQLSELARQRELQRVIDGTHNFLGGEVSRRTNAKRVADGTHNLLGNGDVARQQQLDRVANGTHHWLGNGDVVRERTRKRVADGTYHMCQPDNHVARSVADGTHLFVTNNPAPRGDDHHMRKNPTTNHVVESVKAGTHNFCGGELQREMIRKGTHPSVAPRTCEFCGKEGKKGGMGVHVKTCKLNPNRQPLVREKIECVHCGIWCTKANFTRFHGDNCKLISTINENTSTPLDAAS